MKISREHVWSSHRSWDFIHENCSHHERPPVWKDGRRWFEELGKVQCDALFISGAHSIPSLIDTDVVYGSFMFVTFWPKQCLCVQSASGFFCPVLEPQLSN